MHMGDGPSEAAAPAQPLGVEAAGRWRTDLAVPFSPASAAVTPGAGADSAEDETSRREAVMAKLGALEAARREEAGRRREAAAEAADPRESIAAFNDSFSEATRRAEAGLAGLQADHAAGRAGEAREVNERLDGIANAVFEMERSVANASYFLTSYDLRTSHAAVACLRAAVDAARAELIPKRKFAFSKKVNRVKGSEMAVAAGAAAGAATPASAGGTSATASAGTGIAAGIAAGTAAAAAAAVAAGGGSGAPAAAAADPAAGPRRGDERGGAPPAPASASASPSDQDLKLVADGRGFMGLRDQTIVLGPDQVGGRDFVLIDLQRCDVYLLGHLPALRLLALRECRVVAGPVTGAVFVDGAERCTLCLAAYQARVHSTTDTDFYVRTRSKPIVEHTSRVRFAPLALALLGAPRCGEDVRAAALLTKHRLGEDTGMHVQVEDFGWIKATHSPNWCELPEAEREPPVVVPWGAAAGGGGSAAAAGGSAVGAAAAPAGQPAGGGGSGGPLADDGDEI